MMNFTDLVQDLDAAQLVVSVASQVKQNKSHSTAGAVRIEEYLPRTSAVCAFFTENAYKKSV